APVEDVAKGAFLDERHGQEDDLGGDDEVVDGEDVRVVEPGERPGLELEALEEAWVFDPGGEEGFERDLPAEGLLGRAINDGLAASAGPPSSASCVAPPPTNASLPISNLDRSGERCNPAC